jgi:microcystin-dependent protein
MSQPFLGQIMLFAGNFAPLGWALCNGQLMSIQQNTALFSILGTTYGGNGTTTFGLPDFRGRVPLHWGQGLGLANYAIGQMAGSENTTLLQTNLPSHTHPISASTLPANGDNPNGAVLASGPSYIQPAEANTALAPSGATGGNQPFNNIQPYLALTFVIALQGVFPSRN